MLATELKSLIGKIHQGDCVDGLSNVPAESVDLVFADPPFNIGYQYDQYEDKLEDEHYLDWSRQWMEQVHRVLKANGTFWLAIGDEYAAELKIEAQKLGFHCRSWVIWYYTFGVNCKMKFTRSHAHLFHFVKDKRNFVFNYDDRELRVPSARRLVYNDKRANPHGRMPDDTWILRPQDVVNGFSPSEDTWFVSRVAGTFKERAGFHGCQMPEQLLGRIIRASSNLGDLVVDPFSGSSTTVAVAKKLGREYFSFELSDDYVRLGIERLESIEPGDPLDGPAEPNMENLNADRVHPSDITGQASRKRQKSNSDARQTRLFPAEPLIHHQLAEYTDEVIQAMVSASQGHSIDRLIADPVLNRDFQIQCDRLFATGTAAERNRFLFQLRQTGELQARGIQTQRETKIPWNELEPIAYAVEIACRKLADRFPGLQLEQLFADPDIASQFDQHAKCLAPGRMPFDYRWAAIQFRSRLEIACHHLGPDASQQPCEVVDDNWCPPTSIGQVNSQDLPNQAGLYLVMDSQQNVFFVGETTSLKRQLSLAFDDSTLPQWYAHDPDTTVCWTTAATDDRYLKRQRAWVAARQPAWNLLSGPE